MKYIRSKAPFRISFAGGGTDVSPYPETIGGAVLNATINKYAYCSLFKCKDDKITVESYDYSLILNYNTDKDLKYDGKLDLVKASIKLLKAGSGYYIFLHSNIPPGSGLGSSSTVTVSIVGCLKHFLKLPLTDYEIAEIAYKIERIEMGLSGGKQDQYAATFGGFNFIEFYKDGTIVNPLRISSDIINELEYRLILCFTGQTRSSTDIIDDQTKNLKEENKDVLSAFKASKELAYESKKALLLGKINYFGDCLKEGWNQKKKFSNKITNPKIDEFYDVAIKSGAIGGKLLGAGGGGYLLFLTSFNNKYKVKEQLEKCGGKILDFAFDRHGMQTWEVNYD